MAPQRLAPRVDTKVTCVRAEPVPHALSTHGTYCGSDDWAGRAILIGIAQQIELHPCDVVPAAVLPFDAPV